MKASYLHNKKFGLLTVKDKLPNRDKHGHVVWLCSCDCGGKKMVKTSDLNAERVKSCGCLNRGFAARKVKTKCAYCGKKKEIFPCKAKAYKKTFCNDSCRGKWMSENCTGSDNGKWKPKVEVFCSECGELKKIHESHFKTYKDFFCDNACRGLWMAKKVKGKSNPNYNGGTPIHRIIGHRISAGMRKSLKNGKDGYSWEALLGYTRKQLFDHLDKTMPIGYTWDNLNELHIDHIIPKHHFSLKIIMTLALKNVGISIIFNFYQL